MKYLLLFAIVLLIMCSFGVKILLEKRAAYLTSEAYYIKNAKRIPLEEVIQNSQESPVRTDDDFRKQAFSTFGVFLQGKILQISQGGYDYGEKMEIIKDFDALKQYQDVEMLFLNSNYLPENIDDILNEMPNLKYLELFQPGGYLACFKNIKQLPYLNLRLLGSIDFSILDNFHGLIGANIEEGYYDFNLGDFGITNPTLEILSMEVKDNSFSREWYQMPTRHTFFLNTPKLKTLSFRLRDAYVPLNIQVDTKGKTNEMNSIEIDSIYQPQISVTEKPLKLKEFSVYNGNFDKGLNLESFLSFLEPTALEKLELIDGCVLFEDLPYLKKLDHLEKLNLVTDSIEDLAVIKEMSTLKELMIGSKFLWNIEGIEALVHLNKLVLIHSSIEDYTPLKRIPQLQELIVEEGVLSKLPDLPQLKSLVVITDKEPEQLTLDGKFKNAQISTVGWYFYRE